MTPSLPALDIFFRRPDQVLVPIENQLDELFQFCKVIGEASPLLREWFLASDKSKSEALLYPAFDSQGPTTAALAVLRTKNKGVADVRSISIWNGAEVTAEGASLSSRNNVLGRPDTVALNLKMQPRLSDWQIPLQWMQSAANIWPAELMAFGPFFYDEHKVFPDRPGAGWMLFLPRVLTVQQLPEARALIPVLKEKKQVGTIVVSVTDGAFDLDNPEHIKISNAIEVRLVDQDLLPRFADL